jgi:NADH:ubiquinone oxidoreductase subunit 5 (subunit L)/multisubunit Na+/H+ antiporter MnhA subunit
LLLGSITLVIARTAALTEADAKKVVALSTLSQLGLMYLSLFLGGKFICLFHLLIHAFAKANLFLIVGNFIYSRFSQQDVRFISIGRESLASLVIILIRILSLRGVIFMRGFFSKEVILLSHYTLIRRFLRILLLFGIITLTISYCLKIFFLFRIKSFFVKVQSFSNSNVLAFYPRAILSVIRIALGFLCLFNVNIHNLWKHSLSGGY